MHYFKKIAHKVVIGLLGITLLLLAPELFFLVDVEIILALISLNFFAMRNKFSQYIAQLTDEINRIFAYLATTHLTSNRIMAIHFGFAAAFLVVSGIPALSIGSLFAPAFFPLPAA